MLIRHILFVLALILTSCEGTDEVFFIEDRDIEECRSSVISSGKYYEKNDRRYLYAGEDTTTHFDITDWSLNVCYLENGLGREHFQALITPKFVDLSSVEDEYDNSMEALILLNEGQTKVYPFRLLRQHEMINDESDGIPIMAVYCYLADLVVIYERTYCDEELTFAVSGFTYRDPNRFEGLSSFILWDRNSESLWWPINNSCVGGVYKGSTLRKLNHKKWGRTTMGEVKETYPNAVVLKKGQQVDLPVQVSETDGCQ